MATAPQFYISKDDIAKDLYRVLTDGTFAFGTKRAVLEHVTAVWPEWDDKFDRSPKDAAKRGVVAQRIRVSKHYCYERVPLGCRYWSAGALEKWLENENGNRNRGDYRFEHVVPRGVVRDFLLEPTDSERRAKWRFPLGSAADTRLVLDQICIGAVITRKEDELLESRTFPGDLAAPTIDSWARYRALNRTNPEFVVYDLCTGKPAFKVARK